MLRLFVDLFVYILCILSAITNIVGQGIGGAFNALFSKPACWILHSNPAFLVDRRSCPLFYFVGPQNNKPRRLHPIPTLSGHLLTRPPKHPPLTLPNYPNDYKHWRMRLLAGTGLSSRKHINNQVRRHSDVFGQLGALESCLQKEGVRAAEDQNVDRVATNQGPQAMRHEIDALRSAVSTVQAQSASAKAHKTSNAGTHNALDNKNFASSSHHHFHSCEYQSHLRPCAIANVDRTCSSASCQSPS